MKIINIIMLIITFVSICFAVYYTYNFCTNLDVRGPEESPYIQKR